MKINPSLPGLDQGKATTGTNGDRGASGTSATGSGPAQGDTIHISALSAQLHHMAHFVHKQERDETDGEPPAEQETVSRDRHQRGPRGGQPPGRVPGLSSGLRGLAGLPHEVRRSNRW